MGFPHYRAVKVAPDKQMEAFKCHSSVWPRAGYSTVLSILLNLPSITASNLDFLLFPRTHCLPLTFIAGYRAYE